MASAFSRCKLIGLSLWGCLFTIFIAITAVSATDTCVKSGPCSCKTSKGTLDLTPLGHSDHTAAFAKLQSGDYQYSWNPCLPFTQGDSTIPGDDACVNVAACQFLAKDTEYENLGTQDSATFTTNEDGTVVLSYVHKLAFTTGSISSRSAHVTLKCSKDSPGSTTAQGESTDAGNYGLTYTGVHACIGGSTPSGGSSGLSPGSIICIVFFVLLIVYLIAGILIKVFYVKASGIEILPNVNFWMAVGQCIKAGFAFVFCRNKQSYDNV